jgi:hypothetical protein
MQFTAGLLPDANDVDDVAHTTRHLGGAQTLYVLRLDDMNGVQTTDPVVAAAYFAAVAREAQALANAASRALAPQAVPA